MCGQSLNTFTETTTQSWGSRIVSSITGLLMGPVLVLGACAGLFWNEGRACRAGCPAQDQRRYAARCRSVGGWHGYTQHDADCERERRDLVPDRAGG